MRALAMSFILVLSALPMVGQVEAGESCHKINARARGQDSGAGVTQAQVIGGGLLQGTTVGNFAIGEVVGSEAAITGTVKFTSNNATLTVTVSGTFNLASGAFSAAGPVTDSTGKLAGASGSLAFDGVENLSNGSFVEDISGRICLN